MSRPDGRRTLRRLLLVATAVAVGIGGFCVAERRALAVAWAAHRLRTAVTHPPRRAGGGRDFALVEPIERVEQLRLLHAGGVARDCLLALLRSPRRDDRWSALLLLPELEEEALPAVPELVRIRDDPRGDSDNRRNARACIEILRERMRQTPEVPRGGL